MISQTEKNSILHRILESRHFKDTSIYPGLLRYLVDSTLSKTIPKEMTIAIDVFGKDSSFNINKDSTVRYHIHMLRKKLDDYYQNEGKTDDIRLIIPIGHYEVQYVSIKEQKAPRFQRILSKSKYLKITFVAALLVLNIYLFYRQFYSIRPYQTPLTRDFVRQEDEIWASFFENNFPILIILGDDFLLDEYHPVLKRYRQIRDWEISSESELSTFLIQYPKENLWKSEISGIPFGGANNLMDILPIVYQFHNNVTLKMSSTLTLEEIRNHNIIYIGEFYNLRVLNKIIFKTPIRYQYQPDERLFILGENADTLNTFLRIEAPYEQRNKYNVDYSLLIKIPGFTNENFMFILGFGYGGRLERTKMLGDAELRAGFVAEIRKKTPNFPEYFIAVFEVKSIERTGFANEIKYFKEIPRNFFNE